MNKLAPIIQELALATLEVAGTKPNFPDSLMLDATLIFQSVFMDKMYDFKASKKLAREAGTEIRALVLKYTGLDLHKLANE